MYHKIFISLYAVLFFTARLSSAEVLTNVQEALTKIYPGLTEVIPRSLVLSDEQIKDTSEKAQIIFGESHSTQVQYFTVKENSQIIGYAFEDIVIGKWGPIHYLTGLDKNGTVKQVIVLEYKEIRGKPVAKKRFLRQYKKKTVKDPVKLRKDIDGVTGATISSRSMTNGIRKLLHIFQEIVIE